ncbi:CREB-regulated transcription coactivator 1 isoform X2 [Cylas formicarius]|uniref:CREB-regulated transcription coactivator 1 isoform X2 n=1 Tax=Cylas formicarius TaxID=197179 RepID=UPI002958D0C2|nr:CREB-regulated transcription coactivator 1 isoform X2 [Cylas formicarius]
MANPRKFSEKIALHNHRQAEETAAFEKIMKEVLDVKVATPIVDRNMKNTLRIGGGLGQTLGGSLPDVSAPRPIVKAATSPATSPIKDPLKPNEEPLHARMVPVSGRQSRTRSPVGPIRSTRERKLSPYSSGPYLSPPSDTGWRRTNSDSALHQSAMQGMAMDRNESPNRTSWGMLQGMGVPDRNPNGRPRSSCDVPRVPGIHICPSAHDPGIVQIPIGNNTGSLPDLTNVDFSSPIHIPLDQDQDSSPYSSSPLNNSPSTLSPTNALPGMRHHGRFNFNPPISHSSVPVEKNSIGISDNDFSNLSGLSGLYQQPCSPTSPSPTLQQLQTDGYRSPRPSPQSSPSLGGRHSAPCSPGAPSPLSNDYHIQHQSMPFQQHFEQLTVDWAQLVASLMESGCTWSAHLESDSPVGAISYVDQPATSPQLAQSPNLPDVTSDASYYSSSPSHQLVYPSTSPGLHTTSPNTPTSLPEITLTDFSAGQDFSRQLENEFFTDEQLKEGLGSLDSTDFQILNNSIGISEILEDYRS